MVFELNSLREVTAVISFAPRVGVENKIAVGGVKSPLILVVIGCECSGNIESIFVSELIFLVEETCLYS